MLYWSPLIPQSGVDMNFFNMGFLELLTILLLALILFGPQRLLTLGSSLRKALTEFQRTASDLTSTALEEQDAPDQLADDERAKFVPEKHPDDGGPAEKDQESPPSDR